MQKRIAAQTAGGIALGYPKRRRRGRSCIAGVFSSFGWFSEYSKRGRGAVLFGLARRIGTGMDGGSGGSVLADWGRSAPGYEIPAFVGMTEARAGMGNVPYRPNPANTT